MVVEQGRPRRGPPDPAPNPAHAAGASPRPAAPGPASPLDERVALVVEGLLDARPHPALLLAPCLTLLACNGAARRLAVQAGLPSPAPGQPFRLRHGAETAQLGALAAGATSKAAPLAMRVATGCAEEPDLYCILEGLRLWPERPALLLSIHPRRAAPGIAAGTLMGLFGLTSAEAAIAIALASGEAAEEIAARRRRSQATVRTQIRAVLRKTDCASVLDMAMLLTRLRA